MTEPYNTLSTSLTCPVCGERFGMYAAFWVDLKPLPYCSRRCWESDLIDGRDRES